MEGFQILLMFNSLQELYTLKSEVLLKKYFKDQKLFQSAKI